jgi:UDP-N-acetylmuramate dehydrogenase
VTDFGEALASAVAEDRIHRDVPLAPMTTFHVGGLADWLVETRSADEVVRVLALAHAEGVPVTLLGGGSNVLVADTGVRGLVIRPRGGQVSRVDADHIRADAAVTVNGLVRWAIAHEAGGLEAWAGTPGTVGGAIFGNAHYAGRAIGELVTDLQLSGRDGRIVDVPASAMAFGYDRSRLQDRGEVLLTATFRVSPGDATALRAAARASLAYRKRTQPLQAPSAGCVFQNPLAGRDVLPEGMPWSAGALVDRAGMKGATVGGAQVSSTHANFIVNDGSATAADIRRLIDLCRARVYERFGVTLREEIVYLGAFER